MMCLTLRPHWVGSSPTKISTVDLCMGVLVSVKTVCGTQLYLSILSLVLYLLLIAGLAMKRTHLAVL